MSGLSVAENRVDFKEWFDSGFAKSYDINLDLFEVAKRAIKF